MVDNIHRTTIEHAKATYGHENITFIESSLAAIPLADDIADVVISFETIEHLEYDLQLKFLREAKRVLKPQGQLIISTPNKQVYSDRSRDKNPFHVKEFYLGEFEAFLKTQFKYVTLYQQRYEVASVITGDQAGKFTGKGPNNPGGPGTYLLAVCGDQPEKLNCRV